METTLNQEYSVSTNDLGHVQIKWLQWALGRNRSSAVLNAFASLCVLDFFLIVLVNFVGFAQLFWLALVASCSAYYLYLAARPKTFHVTIIPSEGVILQDGTQISLADITNVEVKNVEIKDWSNYKILTIGVSGADLEIIRTSVRSTVADSLKFQINKYLGLHHGDSRDADL